MTPKLYFSLLLIVLFNVLYLTEGSNYVDQCVTNGDVICMNCEAVGACVANGDGSFRVDFQFSCISGESCSNLFSEDGHADCYRLTAAVSPECMCDEFGTCSSDPFDESSYIECGDDETRSYGSCLAGEVYIEDLCECKPECPECGYYSANDGDCANYVSCITGNYLDGRCPDGFCFNSDDCKCEMIITECPECGFISDPNDPEGFFYCASDPEAPGKCPNGYHFEDDTCSCHDEFHSTVPPTTVITTPTSLGVICDACGYAAYPDDICDKYYHCNEDGTVTIETCPPSLCYDEAECACDFP